MEKDNPNTTISQPEINDQNDQKDRGENNLNPDDQYINEGEDPLDYCEPELGENEAD